MNRIIFILSFIFLTGCRQDTLISAQDFAAKMKQPDIVVLDVRTPEEFKSGHLDAAVNMNWNGEHFMDEVKTLDSSKTVLVYCRTANRSSKAASAMQAAGFKTVYVLDGGIVNWRAAGMPVAGEN